MALAQFGTQDQDQEQEQDQIKGERREERYKCCFDIRVMVWWMKKTNSRDTRERTTVGGGCLLPDW